jgi:hypothetical protein
MHLGLNPRLHNEKSTANHMNCGTTCDETNNSYNVFSKGLVFVYVVLPNTVECNEINFPQQSIKTFNWFNSISVLRVQMVLLRVTIASLRLCFIMVLYSQIVA